MKTLLASLLVLLTCITTTLVAQNIIPTPTVTQQQIEALEAAEKTVSNQNAATQQSAVPSELIVQPSEAQAVTPTNVTVKMEAAPNLATPQLSAETVPKAAPQNTPAPEAISAPVAPSIPAEATPTPEVVAAVPPIEATPKDPCLSMANQEEINQCAATNYSTAFTEMDDIYQKLMGQLDQEQQQLLRQTQGNWTAFRDAHCACETFAHKNSSVESLLNYKCLTKLTQQRIDNLRGLMAE